MKFSFIGFKLFFIYNISIHNKKLGFFFLIIRRIKRYVWIQFLFLFLKEKK